MRSDGVDLPTVSRITFYAFGRYAAWYLRRNFHAVRVSRAGFPQEFRDRPLIICLNHPSWWDPLVALCLARRYFPERTHYAPIEAKSLAKYRLFERIGFFGIEPGTASGAVRFLRVSRRLLARKDVALWVTAQGHFADTRVRPVELRSGLGHLALHLPDAVVIPLALEYPFWQERYPEALARFGEPVPLSAISTPEQWTAVFARSLERTQDALAAEAIARERTAFEVVIGGSAGVGGIYDLWRALNAKVRGERFQNAHGVKEW